MGRMLIICEKPSVARDVATALYGRKAVSYTHLTLPTIYSV